jgi:hypothetical protein
MNKTTKTILIIGAVVGAYYLWKKNQEKTNGTSSASGGGKLTTKTFCCVDSNGEQYQTTAVVNPNTGRPYHFPCADGGSYCPRGIAKPRRTQLNRRKFG